MENDPNNLGFFFVILVLLLVFLVVYLHVDEKMHEKCSAGYKEIKETKKIFEQVKTASRIRLMRRCDKIKGGMSVTEKLIHRNKAGFKSA